MKPLSKHCLVLKQCVICVSSEAACLPLLRALGSDPTGDPKRQELLPGVSTAHPSSGFGFRGPAGWRDPYGRVLQRGFHRWRERLVEMYSTCWQSVSSGSILLIFFFSADVCYSLTFLQISVSHTWRFATFPSFIQYKFRYLLGLGFSFGTKHFESYFFLRERD